VVKSIDKISYPSCEISRRNKLRKKTELFKICDICNSPCKVCGKDLPLHLGDYNTAPEEVECYCGEHLPYNNVTIFTLLEDDTYEDLPYITRYVIYKQGWKMGIRSLTPNAIENKEINFPNVGAKFHAEDL